MSRSVRRIRLDGEKNLDRAAEELGQVLALPERLGERRQALSTAMANLQDRVLYQNSVDGPIMRLPDGRS